MDGAASDAPNDAVVFGVIIGTGVGGGVVIGKRVLDGAQGIAGSGAGNANGSDCCERTSFTVLLRARIVHRASPVEIALRTPLRGGSRGRQARAADLATLAVAGDAHAAEILLDEVSPSHWPAHSGTVVSVLDPHTIVLAGGERLPELAQRVQAALVKYAFSDSCATKVVRAAHGDASGVRGAAWLGQSS